ncbi:hypothetical protein EJB05_27676 [Eragrostis curvula]|uniref:Uncharacterized protein n=1 Tax=Eragrostis curvula TaxID=38414 RepID=A0A5J9UPA1_9POAL|nr:hypothetical protein EJB05_27676 [Eragrostis curvula]
MESKMKIFAVFFFFFVFNRANAEYCKLGDLTVTQAALPGKVPGQTEYTVVVENRCICSQANVQLACPGFNSSMGVGAEVLRPDGDTNLCTLNDGRPVFMGPEYAVKFQYASTSQISFVPVSSTIACS